MDIEVRWSHHKQTGNPKRTQRKKKTSKKVSKEFKHYTVYFIRNASK